MSRTHPSAKDATDLSISPAAWRSSPAARAGSASPSRAFSAAGADVVVASRKADACLQVAAELRSAGGRALGHPCHVGRWDDLARLVEAAYGEFGRVDVLVNNAGVSPPTRRWRR